jgi:hypothetical protein
VEIDLTALLVFLMLPRKINANTHSVAFYISPDIMGQTRNSYVMVLISLWEADDG